MDAIRIQIVRGCDAQGQGGTVVDDAAGVLGELPNGNPILDVLAASFIDAYGLYSYDNPLFDQESEVSESNPQTITVSPMRNVSTRMRLWATEILTAYAAKVAAAAAAEQAAEQTAAALNALVIIDHVGG